jgi:hypothetical protein
MAVRECTTKVSTPYNLFVLLPQLYCQYLCLLDFIFAGFTNIVEICAFVQSQLVKGRAHPLGKLAPLVLL